LACFCLVSWSAKGILTHHLSQKSTMRPLMTEISRVTSGATSEVARQDTFLANFETNLERNRFLVNFLASKQAKKAQGNIYRLWALNMSFDARKVVLTITVVLTQILGAYMMFNFIGREYQDKVAVPFTCLISFNATVPQNASLDLYLDAIFGHGHLDFSVMKDNSSRHIQIKILGFLLMFIVFFTTDHSLLRQDKETDSMRVSFPELMKTYRACVFMWMDSVVNCSTVLMILASSLGVFLNANDVKDMILDAFGLIFLLELDNLGGDVEWGLDDTDFEQILDAVNKHNKEDYRQKDVPKCDTVEEYEEMVHNMWRNQENSVLFSRASHGDVVYSIARIGCYLLIVGALPAFCTLKFVNEKEIEAADAGKACTYLSRSATENTVPVFKTDFKAQILWHYQEWMPWSCLMAILWSTALMFEYWKAPEFYRFSQNFKVPVDPDFFKLYKKDFTGFFFMVLMRRPDARLTTARDMQMQLFPDCVLGGKEWPQTPLQKTFAKDFKKRFHLDRDFKYEGQEGGIFDEPHPIDFADLESGSEEDDDEVTGLVP